MEMKQVPEELQNSSNGQKKALGKGREPHQQVSSISSCLRAWEPYQKKGFDPNETRMLDIIDCWTGEPGPAIALVGIPFDSAVIGRKGAKEGPKKIRDSIRYFKAYDWNLDFWFGDQKVFDFGDVITDAGTIQASHKNIYETTCKIAKRGFIVISLGGDHSISYPAIKGIYEAHNKKSMGLVNIDAHLDVREAINGKINSGTPFRFILENEIVRGENFVEIGIRNFANARTYRRFVEEKGGTIFTVDMIKKQGLASILKETINQISKKTETTYISVDMDGLDQIYAPGVSAPTPNGLSPYEVANIIHEIIKETNVVGMDIVELNPVYDISDITAINAASFICRFVSSFYWKKANNEKTVK
ncbi:MAG: formimidoylglutamase [Candidatus Heimdallarchaeota archaeon]|nr:formimidoylglutamase [Candidatus Heimdallarchaeota archaeon]